jgi:sialidase-1
LRQLRDTAIYSDQTLCAAFPSVVSRPGGELIVAFRRAPERRHAFAEHTTHCNPNSYLILVYARDKGRGWEPWQDRGIIGHPYHAARLPDGEHIV